MLHCAQCRGMDENSKATEKLHDKCVYLMTIILKSLNAMKSKLETRQHQQKIASVDGTHQGKA